MAGVANTQRLRHHVEYMDADSRRAFVRWAVDSRFGGVAARLADKIGVSKSNVGRWLMGRQTPTDENIERLAEKLDLPIEEVLIRDWVSAVNSAPMFFQSQSSPTPTLLHATPPELTQAANWFVQQCGEDPRQVALAASIARDRATGEQLDWTGWAQLIQNWLSKMPKKPG